MALPTAQKAVMNRLDFKALITILRCVANAENVRASGVPNYAYMDVRLPVTALADSARLVQLLTSHR